MSMALSLPNDLPPTSTPSHSTSSLEHPSTPSSAADSVRPKSERRLSLGVLESAKFRLSHDVRGPVASLPLPFYPLLCLTRVVRTPFFRSLHVSSGRLALFPQNQLTQEGLP
jgi:hypothetical protein